MGDNAQRVVITGISRGIGRATALAFARQGARVAGIHRDPDLKVSKRLEDDLLQAGAAAAKVLVGTTASTRDVDRLGDEAASSWGRIDVWVNCAARLMVKPFLEMSDLDWRDLLDSNLFGYVRGCRVAARYMLPARNGRIINIGSAVEIYPPTEMTAYVTAKGGISGLTRALAVELGDYNITVNAIAPGATETPLNTDSWTDSVRQIYRARTALHRIAEADDIAAAIVMFASEQSRYITGQVVLVDGGLTLNGSVGHRKV